MSATRAPIASQTAKCQSKAARIASPCSVAIPNDGKAMCSVWAPWWTPHVTKMPTVTNASRLLRTWRVRSRPLKIVRAMPK